MRSARRALEIGFAPHPRLYLAGLRVLGRGSAERRAFISLVQRGDVVFDVGANRGDFTILLSDLAGPSGAVHAFEPLEPTFAALSRRAARESRSANLHLNRCACAADESRTAMYVPGGDWAQAALRRHAAGSWAAPCDVSTIVVQTIALDAYVQSAGVARVDFVKIDVEGAELDVLAGMQGILDRHRPLLSLELYALWSSTFGHGPSAVLDSVQRAGYDTFIVLDDVFRAATAAEVAETADRRCVNVVCGDASRHRDRVARLVR